MRHRPSHVLSGALLGIALTAGFEHFGLEHPVLLDRDGPSPRLFGPWADPNTALIDRAGRVVGLVRGERDWHTEDARRLVRLLLVKGG